MNLKRRHLTDSQKAVVGLSYLEYLEAEAKERQRQSGVDYGKGGLKVVANLPQPLANGSNAEDRNVKPKQPIAPKSRAKAAAIVGTSERNIQKAKVIQAEPDLKKTGGSRSSCSESLGGRNAGDAILRL